MDQEQQGLKDKAFLLVRRERELYAMRVKHDRLAAWLRLTQSLPELISHDDSLDQVCSRLRRALLLGLRTQRVTFLLCEDTALRALGPGPTAPMPRPLGEEGAALLRQARSGVCNGPGADTALCALAEAVAVERFIWTRIQLQDAESPLLLVAGYTKDKAAFQAPFDADDAAHLENMGQHIEVLLRNKALVSQLERDRGNLQLFNEQLESRVAERTRELARVNDDMAGALASLEEKDRRLAADLREARRFQHSILAALPQRAAISFEAIFRPVDVVGGDVYDVCEVAPGLFRAFMADATGHGVQASLRTIVLKSEYDRLKLACPDPGLLLDAFNERLVAMFPQAEMLSTGACFDIDLTDPASPRLRYANAAHPSLLHVSNGRVRAIECDGPILGVPAARRPLTVEIPLAPGDLLILASDGVWDQQGPASEEFDVTTVVESLAAGTLSVPALLTSLFEELDRFRGPVAITDDITVLTARLAPAALRHIP